MKIATQVINGHKYDIEVVPGTGMFRAEHEGETVESATKAALIQRLKQMTRENVRVEIQAILVEHDELFPITLTGFHQSNGNLLYKQHGKKGVQQMYKWSSADKVLRPLAPTEAGDFKALLRAKREAEKAVERWLKARKIDAVATVNKALAARKSTETLT